MTCKNCGGQGQVLRQQFTQDGITYPEMMVNCFECNGTGEMCDVCGEAADACGCGECEN